MPLALWRTTSAPCSGSSGRAGRRRRARPSRSSARAQPMLLSSSKRAFSSTSTATCLPFAAASSSASHDGRVAADPVQGLLDGQHVRVVGGGAQELDHAARTSRRDGAAGCRVADGGEELVASRGRQRRRDRRQERASLRSGRSMEPDSAIRLPRPSGGARCRRRCRPAPGSRPACRGRAGIASSTVRRTTEPKRRWRTLCSMVSSRSSASSSWMSMSASRITRKGWRLDHVMPGKSVARWAAMSCSSHTK